MGVDAASERRSISPDTVERQAQSVHHKRCGNELLGQGKLDEAAASYRKAISENPEDADVYLNLGFVLSEQKSYEAAEQVLRQALTINPAMVDAFYILGVMNREQGDLAGAIVDLTRALELKPDFELIYGDLCQLFFQNDFLGTLDLAALKEQLA